MSAAPESEETSLPKESEESTSGSESMPKSTPGDLGEECSLTPDNIEGPFYREGIPRREKLDLYGEDALPLNLTGIVRDSNCHPLAGAVVEIWHANPAGEYDISSDERRYYGWTKSNADGVYKFETLMPGRYLNGDDYRPAHIHLKVRLNDELLLTTQVYFEGDPFNKSDAFIEDELIIPLNDEGHGTFNVYVEIPD